MLLALVCLRGTKETFVLGLLVYMAFVLIGPMSSKPHFVPLYGLFLFSWKNMFSQFNWTKLIILSCCTAVLSLTSSGIMGQWAYVIADRCHIGIAGLIIWLYVYSLLWRKA